MVPRKWRRGLEAFESWIAEVGTCHIWLGYTDKNGYGKWSSVWAHRFAYELTHGPVPAGKQLDHLCRVTLCVNPAHLEAVTCSTNMLRAFAARRRWNGRCKYGHDMTQDNTYVFSDGGRHCKICHKKRANDRYYLVVRPRNTARVTG